MKQMAFYIDTSACIGCKTCEIACKDKKNLAMGVRIRRVREYGGGEWVNKNGFFMPDKIFTYFVSASCMHCAQPACLEACPTGSISKDQETGVVVINKETCIGCGSCKDACPYDAPSLNEEEEKMYKCDMCIDLLKENKNPVCIDGCLQRCIKVGELNELHKQYGELNSIEPLPDGKITDASVVFKKSSTARNNINNRVRNTTEQ